MKRYQRYLIYSNQTGVAVLSCETSVYLFIHDTKIDSIKFPDIIIQPFARELEISIDQKTGILREIMLTSIHVAHFIDQEFDGVNIVEKGISVFQLDGNIKYDFCDQKLDFDGDLGRDFVSVDFWKERKPIQFMELG